MGYDEGDAFDVLARLLVVSLLVMVIVLTLGVIFKEVCLCPC